MAEFGSIPGFIGAIEWKYDKSSLVLGMMQEMVANQGDGWDYMLDQLKIFNERVFSEHHEKIATIPRQGTLTAPVGYTEMPEELKQILDATAAERSRLLGIRTGEMHLALASGVHEDFKPEPFSLHYQRSLFSSFQSSVQNTFQVLSKNIRKLPEEVRQGAEEILAMKGEILADMKNIYRKKLDIVKTRIHGDYHLGQTLFTGKDFVILDFEGEPAKPYSERRLKRSPLRDVAGMIRSFHYAAYASLFLNNRIPLQDISKHIPFIEQWYHYMSGFFMRSYMETVKGSAFMPSDMEDLEVLMQCYLLEKAIYELNYELNNRPDWVIIPLQGIRAVMNKKAHSELV